MLQRLRVREGQSAEDARTVLDQTLSVDGWAVPGSEPKPVKARDPKAPWWWTTPEDATETFLKAVGRTL